MSFPSRAPPTSWDSHELNMSEMLADLRGTRAWKVIFLLSTSLHYATSSLASLLSRNTKFGEIRSGPMLDSRILKSQEKETTKKAKIQKETEGKNVLVVRGVKKLDIQTRNHYWINLVTGKIASNSKP